MPRVPSVGYPVECNQGGRKKQKITFSRCKYFDPVLYYWIQSLTTTIYPLPARAERDDDGFDDDFDDSDDDNDLNDDFYCP